MTKKETRQKRHRRIRAKILGNTSCPRLCVFRSNQYIYAQIVDDQKRKTLVSVSDIELKKEKQVKSDLTNKVARAYQVGKLIAEKALKKEIDRICFDRGGYKYHGRVKALAEGAREGGLKF